MYDFLVGLNHKYDQVRVQILGKEKVPRLNVLMEIIWSEESQSLLLETPIAENSTMIVERTVMATDQKMEALLKRWREKKRSMVYLLQQAMPH